MTKKTTTDGALITKLNEVSVPILTDARCKTRYGTNINIDSAICAGENAVNLGPCQGDSGKLYKIYLFFYI